MYSVEWLTCVSLVGERFCQVAGVILPAGGLCGRGGGWGDSGFSSSCGGGGDRAHFFGVVGFTVQSPNF